MENESKFNDELAAYTDALLQGSEMAIRDDVQELGMVVRSLQQTLGKKSQPSPAFQSRLTQRLNDEWQQTQRQRRQIINRNRRLLRYSAALAAVLVLVLALILFEPNDSNTGNSQGTAVGDAGVAFWALLAGVVIGGAVLYWWWQRRQK